MTIKTRNNIFGISLSAFLIGADALFAYFAYFSETSSDFVRSNAHFGFGVTTLFAIVSTVITLVYIFASDD